MKKSYTILAFCFLNVSLFAQTIKKPLIVKRTAEWCTFCGTWGWSFMEDLETQFPNNEAVLIGAHHSGDLANATSEAFIQNFAGLAQPIFYLNNNSLGVNQTTAPDRLVQAAQETAAINLEAPLFNILIDAVKASDFTAVEATIDIQANEDITEDYYIGVYLIHDDLLYTQTSQSGVVEHSKVLVASFEDEVFGRPLNGINQGQGTRLVYTYAEEDILGELSENIFDVAVVIWTKENETFIVEQAEVLENIPFLSNNNEITILENNALFINQADILNFKAAIISDNDKASVSIFDLAGKTIHTENINLEDNQTINYQFDVSYLTPGQYIFSIKTNQGIHSESFIK